MNGFDRSYFIEGGLRNPLGPVAGSKKKQTNKQTNKKKTNRSGYRQLNAIRFKR